MSLDVSKFCQDIFLDQASTETVSDLLSFKPGLYQLTSNPNIYGVAGAAPGGFTLLSRIIACDNISCTFTDLSKPVILKGTGTEKEQTKTKTYPCKDKDGTTLYGQITVVKCPGTATDIKENYSNSNALTGSTVVFFSYGDSTSARKL